MNQQQRKKIEINSKSIFYVFDVSNFKSVKSWLWVREMLLLSENLFSFFSSTRCWYFHNFLRLFRFSEWLHTFFSSTWLDSSCRIESRTTKQEGIFFLAFSTFLILILILFIQILLLLTSVPLNLIELFCCCCFGCCCQTFESLRRKIRFMNILKFFESTRIHFSASFSLFDLQIINRKIEIEYQNNLDKIFSFSFLLHFVLSRYTGTSTRSSHWVPMATDTKRILSLTWMAEPL